MQNMDISQIWNEALEVLKNEVSVVSYTTWFKTLIPIELKNNTIILQTFETFAQGIISQRYSLLIQNAIRQVTNMNFDVKIIVQDQVNNSQTSVSKAPVLTNEVSSKSNLNPKYTFETFVIGGGNRMAYTASLAVAEDPAKAYNPLFLYGGVGLGKTHLMHSIGHYILSQNPNTRILYISSETFTNELINSIQLKNNEAFRNKYRNIDVLLVDDIQFIAGKTGTQEEFFHTFNTLHESNKQIIISSDRPPKEIETLEERLISRFEWGLIADIQPPDLETRIAILKKKVEGEKYNIPDDVLVFVATSIKSNIRELEGAINRILAFSKLQNLPIDLNLAKESLKDFISARPKNITIEYIQEIVSAYYNLKIEDFKSKKRNRAISYPRQIAMYLSRSLTDMSLPKIGEMFGGRDHTTVMHGYDKIYTDINNSLEMKKIIELLENRIKGN
ncbi:MAG TPA: chromosomal replication initiator protein DnaA [Clostridiales bacterium]|nr:MAG: chromosomal replication initiation protein DnaA [Clostridiales bacterium GWD2_32_59]HAN09097.1 chromosomal replication initiator protein DnaA [Clostridiales bacterium]